MVLCIARPRLVDRRVARHPHVLAYGADEGYGRGLLDLGSLLAARNAQLRRLRLRGEFCASAMGVE